MNRLPENGIILLKKAREDAQSLQVLIESGKGPAGSIGFHAQQAVEKAIKAVLSKHFIVFPRTHDLGLLIRLLRSQGLAVPPDADRLPQLTPFGALLRYGDLAEEDQALPDPQWLLDAVGRTLQWAAGPSQGNG